MTDKEHDIIVNFDFGDEEVETTMGDIEDALNEFEYAIVKLYDVKQIN